MRFDAINEKNSSGRVLVFIRDLAFMITAIIIMDRDQLLLILVLGCYSSNTYTCLYLYRVYHVAMEAVHSK